MTFVTGLPIFLYKRNRNIEFRQMKNVNFVGDKGKYGKEYCR
jgi:hypothetical protein